uniref:Uncharacterized protein n=1 Tax=Candidatus Kentrum sp. MB TaxID=2138164 RepID=A0A451B8G2_9GAMM|nr:MAG: hypothetical protein BECKMB1821G_GA0114241_100334 [Candidatus Kentron sp. MB]VFK26518.1 MAG: hypothetical protein BECKMB1821I_GA0114274_100121 [Candidatus Kentron sp. MB]VFK74562.1 MAG: hypothetical protein BECKMB1821H_GA0114242_100653 [Candidatus Kentron sp. MB]
MLKKGKDPSLRFGIIKIYRFERGEKSGNLYIFQGDGIFLFMNVNLFPAQVHEWVKVLIVVYQCRIMPCRFEAKLRQHQNLTSTIV